jgi:alpha-L-fucosidase
MAIDTSGRFPAKDSIAFAGFGREIQRRFGHSLADTRGQGRELVLTLPAQVPIDHLLLMEDIARGENIRKYAVDAWVNGAWQVIAEGTSVGHKRIQSFPPIVTAKLRLHILTAVQTPEIKRFAVYQITKPQN